MARRWNEYTAVPSGVFWAEGVFVNRKDKNAAYGSFSECFLGAMVRANLLAR